MVSVNLFAIGVAFILVAMFTTYVIIMGPSRYHRNGIIGKMHRNITRLPQACLRLCCCCRRRQSCIVRRCTRIFKYVAYERNWLMVVCYILFVWPVEIAYLLISLPQLRASYLSKLVSWTLVISSEVCYMLAVFSDPGIITSSHKKEAQERDYASAGEGASKRGKGLKSLCALKPGKRASKFLLSPAAEAKQNERYVVDGILYGKSSAGPGGLQCVTCNLPRPSRSKHCRLCDHCVRRFDHHCPWINNDVAEGNHRWFLLFIGLHFVECVWGFWDLCAVIVQCLQDRGIWGWTIRRRNGATYHLTLMHYVALILTMQPVTLGICVYTFVIGIVLLIFWLYQMSFVVVNVTMNDMNKIDDTVEFIIGLPTSRDVYTEALNVRSALEEVAVRPPRCLQLGLAEPPEAAAASVGGKEDKEYRKKVKKMLTSDLKGLFDRGVWNNLMEVMFPYS